MCCIVDGGAVSENSVTSMLQRNLQIILRQNILHVLDTDQIIDTNLRYRY